MNHIFESVADGLADQGYAIVDQFLIQSEVEAIIKDEKIKLDIESFQKAGIGKHGKQINEVRGDYIKWIESDEASPSLQLYIQRIRDLIQYLNHSLFLSLKDFEVHRTVYPVGTFYKRHLDQFKQNDHRKLSLICYLNENWDETHGGQLRMHLPSGTLDVFPNGGKLVCFRSDMIEHEVLPATRERYSLTGWILDKNLALKHL